MGGGIFNAGNATITTTTVSGNATARGGNGGAGGQGASEVGGPNPSGAGRGGYGGDGGSASFGQDTYNGVYRLNAAGGGGGIANVQGGVLNMTASTISGNVTGTGGTGGTAGIGGKKSNNDYQTGAHAGWAGSGGLGAGLFSSFGKTDLTNVTINGNKTGDGGTGGAGPQSGSLGPGPGGYGGYGGGIFADGARSPYYVNLTHVTITQNLVGAAGVPGADGHFPGAPGVRGKGAGLATGSRYDAGANAGVFEKNTLIAFNGAAAPAGDFQCFELMEPSYNDIYDLGNNLSWNDTTCPGLVADPKIGLLQDNGGPTKTVLPAAGSPAIGGVPLASCSITTDQRGLPRPETGGTACDIGAVEVGSGPVITPTTTSLSSSLNPSNVGQAVTYTATVSPAPGAGTVSFTDGGAAIAGCSSRPLTAGQSTCSTTPPAGSHSIRAIYSGTSTYGMSTSSTLTQVVRRPPPATRTLTVSKSGSGTVSSSPAGIACGSTCSAKFTANSAVTLTASPASGQRFTGWSGGGCAGTGSCHLTLGADVTVSATFVRDTAACDAATAKVADDKREVEAAAEKLADAKKAKHPSKSKIRRLKKKLRKAKAKLAKDRDAQEQVCL